MILEREYFLDDSLLICEPIKSESEGTLQWRKERNTRLLKPLMSRSPALIDKKPTLMERIQFRSTRIITRGFSIRLRRYELNSTCRLIRPILPRSSKPWRRLNDAR